MLFTNVVVQGALIVDSFKLYVGCLKSVCTQPKLENVLAHVSGFGQLDLEETAKKSNHWHRWSFKNGSDKSSGIRILYPRNQKHYRNIMRQCVTSWRYQVETSISCNKKNNNSILLPSLTKRFFL